MLEKYDKIEEPRPGNVYTSCIKINGVPILPPLITSEKRTELQNDKKKAVDLERRLKCQRDLKSFIERLDCDNLKLGNKRISPNDTCNRTLEHFLSFGRDDSHIAALNIPDISRKNDKELPFRDCNTLVPSKEQNRIPTNLTCNTFDVTQYSDKGVVLFSEYNKSERQIRKDDVHSILAASIVELDLTNLGCAGDSPSDIFLEENKSGNNQLNTSALSKLPSKGDEECIVQLKLLTETTATSRRTSSPFNSETCHQPKPRLLRSNSYTLESPSPILLEHFKKQAVLESNDSYAFEKYSGQKRRSLDLGNHYSTLFDNFVSKDRLESTVPVQDTTVSNEIARNLDCSSTVEVVNNNDYTLNACDFISIENISQAAIQDLAQKHFATSNECQTQSLKKPEMQDVTCNVKARKNDDLSSLNSRVVEAEAALKEVLCDLPENYAKEIIALLERHKKEQEAKLKSCATFKQKLLDQNSNLRVVTKNKSSSDSHNDSIVSNDKPTHSHDCSQNVEEELQLLQFDPLVPEKQVSVATRGEETNKFVTNSPTDTLNALNTSMLLLIDFESDSCGSESLPLAEHNLSCNSSDPLHVLKGNDDYRRLATNSQEKKTAYCNRELFPERLDTSQRKLREQWAATVLTAAAKGYLVRRLKRTERVKNLIQTIKDALLCAMSLHTENSESIRPPDVELHRRLIQQVSAACYEFYDIFFTLTTKEQMALIAMDRQRLQEKLKRPKSASSLKLDSGRSTPKSQRHSFNMRQQKKSLTPSFAA